MARRTIEQSVALITGASSGIGAALARALAAAGADLVLTARRGERLEALAEPIRGSGRCVETVAGDITDAGVRGEALAACRTAFGRLDVLVNSAGITALGPFQQASADRLRHVMEVNFFAAAELIRASIPLLSASRGATVVNIGSVLGHRAVGWKAEYCASKFALHGLSDALRAELAPQGIQLLLVSPSTTDSELFDAAIEDSTGIDWKRRGAVPAAYVARKTVAAIRRGAHEIILPPSGQLLVWLDRLTPKWADRLVERDLRRSQ